MARKLRAIIGGENGTVPENIEALAAQAKQKRIDLCSKEINTVLEKHNCALDIALSVGDQLIRLNAIVALPGSVQVISK